MISGQISSRILNYESIYKYTLNHLCDFSQYQNVAFPITKKYLVQRPYFINLHAGNHRTALSYLFCFINVFCIKNHIGSYRV